MAHNKPKIMRRIHIALTWAWVLMIPLSIATGWIQSVIFVSAISLWANVASHAATAQGYKVEEKQDS